MFDRLFTIARSTCLETVRQPIYGVLLLATAVLLVLNVFLAGYTLDDDNKLLMDVGLSTMLLSGMFLAAFSASGVLTREIESKTVLTVISKPIGRPLFLVGKCLGLLAAQAIAYYLSFLIFVLCMHHRVLQYSSDPFDWPAIIFGGGAVLLTLLLAGGANYFYGKEFASTALSLALPLLTLGTLITAFFDREWKPAPFTKAFLGGQILTATLLIFLAILIISAVALAASTRLGQVMTLMTCVLVLIAGVLSDWVLGQHQETSTTARILYYLIPNINLFCLVDAISHGITVPLSYVLQATAYAVCWIVAILALGIALFQRREVG